MKKNITIFLVAGLLIVLFLQRTEHTSKYPGPIEESRSTSESISTKAKNESLKNTQFNNFNLSTKKHYYDPAHTFERSYSNSHRINLAWRLEPFSPSPKEFQYLAQYEASMENLSEVIDDSAFFTPEGRALYAQEATKLKGRLKSQLGKDRYARYEYVYSRKSGYANAWRVLNANKIDTSKTEKLLELATSYNRDVFGSASIDMRDDIESWFPSDNEDELKEQYRIKIQQLFGKQVLFDIMALNGSGLFFNLDFDNIDDLASYKAEGYKDPWDDEATARRLMKEYNVQTSKWDDDQEAAELAFENREQLHQREMEFQEKHQEEFNKIMQLTSQESSSIAEIPVTAE